MVTAVALGAGVYRFIVRRRRLWQALAVVGSASYGAWLIYPPSAFFVAAALLLLDLITDRS